MGKAPEKEDEGRGVIHAVEEGGPSSDSVHQPIPGSRDGKGKHGIREIFFRTAALPQTMRVRILNIDGLPLATQRTVMPPERLKSSLCGRFSGKWGGVGDHRRDPARKETDRGVNT